MLIRRVGVVVVLCAFAIGGCKDKEKKAAEPPKTEAAKAPKKAAPASATKVSKEAGRVKTASFTMPLPAGYKRVPQPAVDKMSQQSKQKVEVALFKPRAQPDYFITSIVVTKVATTEMDPKDEKACAQAAALSAKAAAVKSSGAKIIKLPIGRTCQFEMGDKHRAIQTVVYLGKAQWTVTCNFDSRDTPSRSECAQVLNGFAGAK